MVIVFKFCFLLKIKFRSDTKIECSTQIMLHVGVKITTTVSSSIKRFEMTILQQNNVKGWPANN